MTNISITPRTRGFTLGAALLTVVALTACGPSSVAEPGASDELTSFTFPASAYNSAIGYFPIAVADSLGYFEEEGLQLEMVPVGGGGESVRGFLADRDALLGSVGYLAALPAIDQGEEFRIFGQISQRQDTWVAVKADGPIKDADDLKGGTIGASRPGSSLEAVALTFLDSEGLTTDDVEVVYLGSVPDLVVALEEGLVDAIAGNGYATITQKVDVDGEWTRFGDIGEYSPGVDAVYVARTSVIENQPEVMAGFQKARDRAVEYIAANPEDDELVAILKEWSGISDPGMDSVLATVLATLSADAAGFFGEFESNLDSFERAAEEGLDQGAITSVPEDWSKYVVESK